MKAHFERMAAYSTWANRRLMVACGGLSAAAFEANRGAYFGSLLGTLNHLLAVDRIWLKRLTGEGEAPDRLDAILYDSFETLRPARDAEDERIAAYVASLTEAELAVRMTFRTMGGREVAHSRDEVLSHLFNHQTHHRGQAHNLLSQLGQAAPPLDLIYFLRE